MKSIKSILSKYHISSPLAGITMLSLLVVPIIPLVAFAVSDVNPPSIIDTIAPVVFITTPADNSTTTKKLSITTSATDNVGVTKVELYIDGVLKTSTTTTPYTFTLDRSVLKKGVHTLTLKAYDAAGNVGTSSDVKVTVTGKSMKIHHDNKGDNKNKQDKKEHSDRRENNLFGKSQSNSDVENDD